MASLSLRTLIEQNHIQKIHLLTKEEVNQQDRKGRTLLHWAVILKNYEMVKILVGKRCRLDICDHQFETPLNYSERESEIATFLEKRGSPIRGSTALHLAARAGDLKWVKAILAKNKEMVSDLDSKLNLPICYAALYQREDVVKYLIAKGSLVDWIDENQCSLVKLAKSNGKDTPLSEYLKIKIGPSERELNHLVTSFKQLLEKELATAKKLNKKLVVMFGESHGLYSIYVVEKAFLAVAKELGINQLYIELPSNEPVDQFNGEIELDAKRLHMNTQRIDDHLFRDDASVDQRNIVMTKKVRQDNKHCIMIVGVAHIKGMINKKSARLPPEQFHVVPLNLGPIAANGRYGLQLFLQKKLKFIDNASNVIQVSRKGMTTANSVIKKCNNNKPNTRNNRAFISATTVLATAIIIGCSLYGLYLAVGIMLSSIILVGTFFTGLCIQRFIEKQKTFGLKEYSAAKNTLSNFHEDKLKAFMDGTDNSLYSILTSFVSYRDWRYMRDYYAGSAAKEVEKEKLITRVKARLG